MSNFVYPFFANLAPLAGGQLARTPRLVNAGQLGTSAATIYTAPSLTNTPTGAALGSACVRSLIVCNTDSSARTYTIYAIESGGSAADNRAIFKDATIAAKTTHVHEWASDAFPLGDAATLSGLADSATKVTVTIGVEQITY